MTQSDLTSAYREHILSVYQTGAGHWNLYNDTLKYLMEQYHNHGKALASARHYKRTGNIPDGLCHDTRETLKSRSFK